MEERIRIRMTEACGIPSLQLARLLPNLRCTAQIESVKCLDQSAAGPLPDVLILSVSEANEAEKLFGSASCAILLLGEKAEVQGIWPWTVANGFLCGEREQIEVLFPQLLAFSRRLRSSRVRENSLQKKLSDTKLVNRAKLLLVTRLQMSETEAHRYIEKTAMDNGESRLDVALRLIRTYEE